MSYMGATGREHIGGDLQVAAVAIKVPPIICSCHEGISQGRIIILAQQHSSTLVPTQSSTGSFKGAGTQKPEWRELALLTIFQA